MLSKIIYSFYLSVLLFGFTIKGQNTFNTYYPSGSKSSAFRTENINGNFLLSSYYIDNITGQQGLDLNLLDNIGVSLLHKTFLFGNFDFLSQGNNRVQCNISSSTILLTGSGYTDTASTVIFTSINKSSLDTNWAKNYTDGYNYHINNVFKVKPNEIWFMGVKFSNSGYNTRPTAFKTDTLGNILAIKEYTNLINYSARNVFFDTQTNLLYITAEDQTIVSNIKVRVLCLDTIGNIIWNKKISGNPFIYQITKHDSMVVCSGYTQVSCNLSTCEDKLTLFKLRATTGDSIWQKTYGKAYLVNTLTAFIIKPNGDIFATGSYSDKPILATVNHDACLLKVNSSGDSLWMKTYSNYGQGVQEFMFDVQPTPDGGYIMCGAPNYASNTQAWVVKTDSLGIAPGMVLTGINETEYVDANFKIYPNPAGNELTVEILNGQAAEVKIYNVNGRLILRETLTKEEKKKLDISALINGVYLICFTAQNGSTKTDKLIIVK